MIQDTALRLKVSTIWKFPLYADKNGLRNITVPKGSIILSCQMQMGLPTLWMSVDATAETVTRTYRTLLTGEDMRPDLKLAKYIATLQDGGFVQHVFECYQ